MGSGGGRAPTPQRERRTSSCVRRRSKIAARASISRKEVAAPAAPSADGARGRSRRRRACHRRDLPANQLRRGPLLDPARRMSQALAGVGQPRMTGACPVVPQATRLEAVPPHQKDVFLHAWECKLDQLIPRAPRRRRAMWVATIWLLVPQPGATGSPMTWDKRSRPPLGGSGAPSGPPFPPDALCGPNRRSTR